MANELPLFYKNLVPFDSKEHAGLKFPQSVGSFAYARETNLIPIFIGELADASRHYPLVFINAGEGQGPVLAAVVGLGDGTNRMIDDKGNWRAGFYIPAYVRRYPFIALRNEQGGQLSLGFDKDAPGIGDKDGEALLDKDGKATERLERIMQFEAEFQRNADVTRAMAKKLADAGLMEESSLNYQLPGQTEQKTVSGFMMINEKRLRDLPDEKVTELFRADCLALAYGHLVSLGNLARLLETV